MKPRSPLPSSASMPCVSTPPMPPRTGTVARSPRRRRISLRARSSAHARWPKSSSAPRWRSGARGGAPASRRSRRQPARALDRASPRKRSYTRAGRPALRASIEQALGLYVQFSEGMDAAEARAPGTRPRGGARRRRVARRRARAARSFASTPRTRTHPGFAERAYDLAVKTADPQRIVPASFYLRIRLVGAIGRDAQHPRAPSRRVGPARRARTAAQASWYLGIVEVRACRLERARARGTCARASDPVLARGDGIRRTSLPARPRRGPSRRTSTRHASSPPPAAGSPSANEALLGGARRDVRDRRAVERRCGGRPRALRVPRRPDRDEGGVGRPGHPVVARRARRGVARARPGRRAGDVLAELESLATRLQRPWALAR